MTTFKSVKQVMNLKATLWYLVPKTQGNTTEIFETQTEFQEFFYCHFIMLFIKTTDTMRELNSNYTVSLPQLRFRFGSNYVKVQLTLEKNSVFVEE